MSAKPVSSAGKSQAIDQSIDQSSNQASDLSIDQSHEMIDENDARPSDSSSQSRHLGLLEQLPAVIFVYICSFLSINTKCWKLPVLSRSVRNSFDHTHCCRGKMKLSITSNMKKNQHVLQSVKYMKFASSICIEWIDVDVDNVVFPELLTALSGSNLTSLEFVERISSSQTDTAIVALLSYLNQTSPQQLKNLVSLNLELSTPSKSPFMYNVIWSGLAKCQSLQNLNITYDPMLFTFEQINTITTCLPNSLISVRTIVSRVDFQDFLHDSIIEQLIDPDYLPHLQYLNDGNCVGDDTLLVTALATVMNATGYVRPFKQLQLYRYDENILFGTEWGWQLLDLTIILCESKMLLFAMQGDNILPILTRLDIVITRMDDEDPELDLSSLFMFFSNRPLEILSVLFDDDTERRCAALSQNAIECFLELNTLTSLKIDAMCLVLEACLFASDIEVASQLSLLRTLDVSAPVCDYTSIASLIKAAPQLEHVNVADTHIEWNDLVPLIARYCPNIQSICQSPFQERPDDDIFRPFAQTDYFPIPLDERVTLADLRTSFAARPLTSSSLQHLTKLALPLDQLQPAALHFLLSQLRHARGLAALSTMLSSPSELEVCVLSRLTHLVELPVLPIALKSLYVKIGTNLEDCFDRLSENSSSCFNTVVNGRDRFFELMKSHLSPLDRLTLDRWDAGDYLQL